MIQIFSGSKCHCSDFYFSYRKDGSGFEGRLLEGKGQGGETGETGEEFTLFNNSILTGLTGLADRTICYIE